MDLQSHGTTTLAFEHQDSVFICVDSKASLGSYVGSKTVRKLLPISNNIVATMAGGAADCFHLIRSISLSAKLWEVEFGSSLPVSGIAKILSTNLKKYKHLGWSAISNAFPFSPDQFYLPTIISLLFLELSVGTMIAGYDEVDGPSRKNSRSFLFVLSLIKTLILLY